MSPLESAARKALVALGRAGNAICAEPEHDTGTLAAIELARRELVEALAAPEPRQAKPAKRRSPAAGACQCFGPSFYDGGHACGCPAARSRR